MSEEVEETYQAVDFFKQTSSQSSEASSQSSEPKAKRRRGCAQTFNLVETCHNRAEVSIFLKQNFPNHIHSYMNPTKMGDKVYYQNLI